MKTFLGFLICILFSISAKADCAGTGISVFPTGSTIKQNSIFIIDGYAESQNVILGLNKNYNIYLKSGKNKIKLLVIETCVGEFYLTQALLKPQKELEVGTTYTLVIDSLPRYESLNRYNKVSQKKEPITFEVTAAKDVAMPELEEKPKEVKKTLVHYGCGPSIHVVFSNPAKDQSEMIIRTTVKNVETGKETTYYLGSNGDKIKVGHGMCAGAFDLESGMTFEVEFSFMDASGNLTEWKGERLRFTKPTKETTYDEE